MREYACAEHFRQGRIREDKAPEHLLRGFWYLSYANRYCRELFYFKVPSNAFASSASGDFGNFVITS